MAYRKSYESTATMLIDAQALQAKAALAKEGKDDDSARRFLAKASKLFRAAGVIVAGVDLVNQEPKTAPIHKRHRRTRREMDEARTAGLPTSKKAAAQMEGSRRKLPHVGDVVEIARGTIVFSDDPAIGKQGKAAGRTYHITVGVVDEAHRTIGWRGNAGYGHWTHANKVKVVQKAKASAHA